MTHYESPAVQCVAPDGIAEITAGIDLARVIALVAATVDWPDGSRGVRAGDIVVITSKAVAKAEGRTRPAVDRTSAEAEETVDVLAEVPGGRTRIVRNRHGLVLAAAGIDESNAPDGSIVLLPSDPDQAARDLRRAIQESLSVVRLGVVLTDTLGRAWRLGQVDTAIGVAGFPPLMDLAGAPDETGRSLSVTAPALADELAGLSDLVKGKAAGRPVAFVRGLAHLVTDDDGPGAQALVRPPADDLFARGAADSFRDGLQAAVGHRRTVRQFSDRPVAASLIRSAVADAINAPAPHHTTPWRFVHVRGEPRTRLLDAMVARWRRDLAELDGFSPDSIDRRVRRGDVLRTAPELVVPFVSLAGSAHDYPDLTRRGYERDLFVLSGGAAVQNFMIGVAARGAATAWVSSTAFCPDVVRNVMDVPFDWQPLGAVAVGYADVRPAPRAKRDASDFLHTIE